MATNQKKQFAQKLYAWYRTTQTFLKKFTAIIAYFHFPHYMRKFMENLSCHSNQSTWATAINNILFVELNALFFCLSCHGNQFLFDWRQKMPLLVPPAYRCYMWNLVRIGFMASEEMLFETVDDRWTTDAWLNYKLTYEPSAQVS